MSKLKGRTGGNPKQRRGPLRKIVERIHHGATIFDADWVRLECGHETLSNGIYKARCIKCSMNEAGLAS